MLQNHKNSSSQYSNYLSSILQQQKKQITKKEMDDTFEKLTKQKETLTKEAEDANKNISKQIFERLRKCKTPQTPKASSDIQYEPFRRNFSYIDKRIDALQTEKALIHEYLGRSASSIHSAAVKSEAASDGEDAFITNLKAMHGETEARLPPIQKPIKRLRSLAVKRNNQEYLMYGVKYKQYANGILKDKSNQLIMTIQEIDIIKEKLEKVNNILRSGINVRRINSIHQY